jgi:hypothetical protein
VAPGRLIAVDLAEGGFLTSEAEMLDSSPPSILMRTG